MKYVFITGIPAAGKSYLAKKVAETINIKHIDVDIWRKELSKNPELEPWVNFFRNQNENEYLKNTSCDKHWENLTKQSEALWPSIKERIEEIIKTGEAAIFEGVNLLPHLVAKDFNWLGIILLARDFEKVFERNKKEPRWGKTEALQKKEAEFFFSCERFKYKEEADRYGFKTFDNIDEAERELLKIF